MKASEIRIGNAILRNGFLFEDKNKFTEKICEHQDIEACFRNPEGFKPITLTEEWGRKLGFIHQDGTKLFNEKFNRLYLDFSNTIAIHFGNHNGLLKIVDYVHKVQNIVFELTEEELTINK